MRYRNNRHAFSKYSLIVFDISWVKGPSSEAILSWGCLIFICSNLLPHLPNISTRGTISGKYECHTFAVIWWSSLSDIHCLITSLLDGALWCRNKYSLPLYTYTTYSASTYLEILIISPRRKMRSPKIRHSLFNTANTNKIAGSCLCITLAFVEMGLKA